jgi:hypothetical protein
LVAVIVGISYFKAKRGPAMTVSEYEAARKADTEQLWGYEKAVDSLRYLLRQREIVHEKTLQRNDLQHRHEIDSLLRVLDGTSDPAAAKKGNGARAQHTLPPDLDSHRQQVIIDYYKNLYRDLPRDLSEYERRVALHEIRIKTVQEFSIGLDDLNAIRSLSGLTY